MKSARRTPSQTWGRGLLLWLCSLFLGCPDAELARPTQVTAQLFASAAALAPATALRVRVSAQTPEGWQTRDEQTFSLATLPAWPLDVVITPRDRDHDDALFELVAELLDDSGRVLVQQRVLTALVPDEQRVLSLWLSPCGSYALGELCESDSSCVGALCKTCVGASCAPTPTVDARTLPVLDPLAPFAPNAAASVPGAVEPAGMVMPVGGPVPPVEGPAPHVDTSCPGEDEDRVGGACVRHDDCLGVTSCGAGSCVDGVRSYSCTCPATAFTGSGTRTCAEVDACSGDTRGCDESPLACVSTAGVAHCACPATHAGTGVGTGGCTHRVEALLPVGAGRSCARMGDRSLKCWGRGSMHKLGDAMPKLQLGEGHHVLAVVDELEDFCALRDDGRVYCWGENRQGTLGVGDRVPRPDEPGLAGSTLLPIDLGAGQKAIGLAGGLHHACALLENHTIKCWGDNWAGQLGLGDTQTRGDSNAEMGDQLPIVDLGSGRTARSVHAVGSISCAVLDDQTVKCWGNTAALLGNYGNPLGDEPHERGGALPALPFTEKVITLGMGGLADGLCALLVSGSVQCLGNNGHGQHGRGDRLEHGTQPGDPPLQSALLGAGRRATGLHLLMSSTCALLDDGSVKCWGDNRLGQLGLGDTMSRGSVPGELGDALPTVPLGTGRKAVSIAGGARHVCALLDDATVKCWGDNSEGSLGKVDLQPLGDQPGELGDALAAIDFGGS